MHRDDLVILLAQALERSAARLHAVGHENPWPEDLKARDIVRLLRQRSREVLKVYGEEDEG